MRFFQVIKILTQILYLKGPSVYTKNQIFALSVVGVNVFRDFGLMIIEIILNIILVVLLKRFMEKKLQISTNQNGHGEVVNKNIKIRDKAIINNVIIAVIMGILSVILHLATFSVIF